MEGKWHITASESKRAVHKPGQDAVGAAGPAPGGPRACGGGAHWQRPARRPRVPGKFLEMDQRRFREHARRWPRTAPLPSLPSLPFPARPAAVRAPLPFPPFPLPAMAAWTRPCWTQLFIPSLLFFLFPSPRGWYRKSDANTIRFQESLTSWNRLKGTHKRLLRRFAFFFFFFHGASFLRSQRWDRSLLWLFPRHSGRSYLLVPIYYYFRVLWRKISSSLNICNFLFLFFLNFFFLLLFSEKQNKNTLFFSKALRVQAFSWPKFLKSLSESSSSARLFLCLKQPAEGVCWESPAFSHREPKLEAELAASGKQRRQEEEKSFPTFLKT